MTPKEFEIKVRELYGIPQDFDLESVPDDDMWWVLDGRLMKPGIARYDIEGAHARADKLMYAELNGLGYQSAVRILDNVDRWYA